MGPFHFKTAEKVRPPAAAGRFYPRDPGELRSLIQDFLLKVAPRPGPGPKALIAPHAGYPYSGPIAASAYAALLPDREVVKRVVLAGPAHFVAFEGLAVSSAEAFATPLGVVPVDVAAVQELISKGLARELDIAHAREHSLEVHLPFLQVVLKDFALVPLVAGEATPEKISSALETLWGGPETRFVISSDLSHYLDSEAARRLDATTAAAIEALDAGAVGEEQACGRIPIRGLLAAAAKHRLHAHTADLRNSADTGGPPEQVVGYGAFLFENESPHATDKAA